MSKPNQSATADAKEKESKEYFLPSNSSSYHTPPNYADLYPEGEKLSPTGSTVLKSFPITSPLPKNSVQESFCSVTTVTYSQGASRSPRPTLRGKPADSTPRVFQKLVETGNPTVFKSDIPTSDDIVALLDALTKDETHLMSTFIRILCHRTCDERMAIVTEYRKQTNGNELLGQLRDIIKDDLSKMFFSLLNSVPEINLFYLHESLRTLDMAVVCDIICTASNYELNELKENHLKKYKVSLEKYIESLTTSHFEPMLLAICECKRDESGVTNLEAARLDAIKLEHSGHEIPSFSYNIFKDILTTRNFGQIKLISQEFQKVTQGKETIEDRIKEKFSGHDKEGYLCLIDYANGKTEFYANRLRMSMAGLGTNEHQLTRIIVLRSEIDMADIKAVFEQITGKSLKSWIKGDTSGFYKYCLYHLIGERSDKIKF